MIVQSNGRPVSALRNIRTQGTFGMATVDKTRPLGINPRAVQISDVLDVYKLVDSYCRSQGKSAHRVDIKMDIVKPFQNLI